MSRANQAQGLQVALIIFAILATVLGATCVVLFHRSGEAQATAQAIAAEAEQLRASATAQQEEIAELKRIVGQPSTASLDSIRARLANDVQPLAAALPEDRRAYRPAITYLQGALQASRAEVAQGKAEADDLRTRYTRAESTKDVQIARIRKSLDEMGEKLLRIEKEAQESRDRSVRNELVMQDRVKRTQAEADVALAAAAKQLADLKAQYQKLVRENQKLLEQLE